MLEKLFRSFGRVLLMLLLVLALGSAVVGGFGWYWLSHHVLTKLPANLSSLKDWRPPTSCQVHSATGAVLDEFYLERRIWVPLNSLPAFVWQSFVVAEDRRFFQHPGVDLIGIVRAFVTNLSAGSTRQGGSTITQQLVKNILVGNERTYTRKISEALLAWRLEQELSKEQILELYINYIYLGSGNYGVEAAARDYFDVPARKLNPGQASLLAGLVPAPARYSPRNNPERAHLRRELVLRRMAEDGFLTDDEVLAYLDAPVIKHLDTQAPHKIGVSYMTQVRREIRNAYGEVLPLEQGLHVYTPLDPHVQDVAEAAVLQSVQALKARHPVKPPPAEAAAIVMENATGRIIALVGGTHVSLEGFVRATQARRQPGSSFKPFVWATALLSGRTQFDTVIDGPLTLPGASGQRWSPKNYDGKYHGKVTLRQALANSLNTVSVRLVLQEGADKVADVASNLGIHAQLRRDLTLALGSSEVTLLDLVRAYSTIARMGVPIEPTLIDSVFNSKGDIVGKAGTPIRSSVYDWPTLPGGPLPRALPADIAYELADMLREVVRSGTARAAYKPGVDRAGKTGTSNDCIDAWFLGFTARYTVGVWVGTDGHGSLGDKETGGKAALPAWIKIMEALPQEEGERLPLPDEAALVQIHGSWFGVPRGKGAMPQAAVSASAPLPNVQ
jgi:penicillin-binding protein 1A